MNGRAGRHDNQLRLLFLVVLWGCRVHATSSSTSGATTSVQFALQSSNNYSASYVNKLPTCPPSGELHITKRTRKDHNRSRWRQSNEEEAELDVTRVDSDLLPDYWDLNGAIDPRIRTNGDSPEQLVKVTDRRHRHPVFATICSIGFLLTIIGIIVICTH